MLQKIFICLASVILFLEIPQLLEKGFPSLRGTSLDESVHRNLDLEYPKGTKEPEDELEWPVFDLSAIVPTGTYAHAPYGRVLLYITTHFSEQHEMYFRYCWKNLLARSPLLQMADVSVLLNANEAEKRAVAMDVLKETFENHNLVVHIRSYDENLKGVEGEKEYYAVKKTGAVMAVYEAVTNHYFDGYDWVIRVNPDVLIRDDSFLMEAMEDPEVKALLIDCHGGRGENGGGKTLAQTDFFMIKPELLLEENNPKEINVGAEKSFTDSIQSTVLDAMGPKNYRWIPGTDPRNKKTCRAGNGRDYYDSPIVHEHAMHPDICTVPQGKKLRKVVNSVFPEGWPEHWTVPV